MSCITKFDEHCQPGSAPGECWKWNGPKDTNGYGLLHCGGKRLLAHRFSLMLEDGNVQPDGLLVLHSCDNPECANPKHLSWGTQADNMRDMVKKGRHGKSVAKGESHPAAKYKESDIVAIRLSTLSHTELARQYGVTPQSIAYVRGKGWGDVAVKAVAHQHGHKGLVGAANKRAILTDDSVREIRASMEKTAALAAKYGVTSDCIRQVKRRIRWSHIE